MCAGPTKFGSLEANAVGEEYLRKCVVTRTHGTPMGAF